jgi:hypothetical protein
MDTHSVGMAATWHTVQEVPWHTLPDMRWIWHVHTKPAQLAMHNETTNT